MYYITGALYRLGGRLCAGQLDWTMWILISWKWMRYVMYGHKNMVLSQKTHRIEIFIIVPHIWFSVCNETLASLERPCPYYKFYVFVEECTYPLQLHSHTHKQLHNQQSWKCLMSRNLSILGTQVGSVLLSVMEFSRFPCLHCRRGLGCNAWSRFLSAYPYTKFIS